MDPQRRTSKPGRARHLLSLIGLCDVCGGELTVSYRYDGRRRCYVCRDFCHVRIGADDLDQFAEALMCRYLSRRDVIAELRRVPEHGGELEALRGELAAARSELAALRAAGRARKVTVATVLDLEPALASAVESLEARERELQVPPALVTIPPGGDVARRWAQAPMSARRQVARLLLSGPVLGELRLMRAPSPGPACPAGDRVSWARSPN
jgi:site-specific DNA recombinase